MHKRRDFVSFTTYNFLHDIFLVQKLNISALSTRSESKLLLINRRPGGLESAQKKLMGLVRVAGLVIAVLCRIAYSALLARASAPKKRTISADG